MAAADIAQAALGRIQHDVNHGDEVPAAGGFRQLLVDRSGDGAEALVVLGMRAQQDAEGRHGQGGRNTVTGDVRHGDAQAPLRQGHEIVIIAANFLRRDADPGYVVAGQTGRGQRQQVGLHIFGQRELLIQQLFFQQLAVQDGFFQGDGGRISKELQHLQVALVVGGQPVGFQVEGADGALAAEDGHGDLRQGRGAARHIVTVQAHIGGDHTLAGGDHMADDALAVGQHFVIGGARVVAAPAHAGDQVAGGGEVIQRQGLVEGEDAGRVVGHDGLDSVEDVRHDLVQVQGVADLLEKLKEEVIALLVGEVHLRLIYRFSREESTRWGDAIFLSHPSRCTIHKKCTVG